MKLVTKNYPKPGLNAKVIEVIKRDGHKLGDTFVRASVVIDGKEIELEELPLSTHFDVIEEEVTVLEKVIEIFGDNYEIKNKRTKKDIEVLKVIGHEIINGIHYFTTNGCYEVDGTKLTLYFRAQYIKSTNKFRIISSR